MVRLGEGRGQLQGCAVAKVRSVKAMAGNAAGMTDGARRVLWHARSLAQDAGRPVDSVILVVAILATPCEASELLDRMALDVDAFLDSVAALPVRRDAPRVVSRIRARAAHLAGDDPLDALHVLAAIATEPCVARRALRAEGLSLAGLERAALAALRARPRVEWLPSGRQGGSNGAPTMPVARRTHAVRDGAGAQRDPEPPRAEGRADSTDAPGATGDAPEGRAGGGLDAQRFGLLNAVAVDLTAEARAGTAVPVVGREREIDALLDALLHRGSTTPCLVGEPGAGKTAVVSALALRLAREEPGVRILMLRAADLLGEIRPGTPRWSELCAQMRAVPDAIKLFFDDLHLLWMPGLEPAYAELHAVLVRGGSRCLAATTPSGLEQVCAMAPGLRERLELIELAEPSTQGAAAMVAAQFAGGSSDVEVGQDVVDVAVRLGARYGRGGQLPGKAVAFVQRAVARARREGRQRVTVADVAQVVSALSGLAPEVVLRTDAQRAMSMGDVLRRRIIGQDAAIERVVAVVKRAAAGLHGRRPMGSFLFAGPTGAGKTELARALAAALFDDDDAIVQLDMSEYTESHAVAKLIGAPPGYVGFERGGVLTEALRERPYQVVLFDEFEKAHRDVWKLLLPVLDEGRLRDARGFTVGFEHTVVVLTTNLGSDEVRRLTTGGVGFGVATAGMDVQQREEGVLRAARQALPPELWGRIDEKIVFWPLDAAALRRVAVLRLREVVERVRQEHEVSVSVSDRVLDLVVAQARREAGGARTVRHAVRQRVEGALADVLVGGAVGRGAELELDVDAERVVVRVLPAQRG